jgi:predicted ferric reductase
MTTQSQARPYGADLKPKRAAWIGVYALLIFSPLIIWALGLRPIEREFLRELSVALGFLGLSLMGLQFVPTARLPFLTKVADMDTLYTMHHKLSILAFLLVLAHPLLLFVENPFTLRLLNLATAPWRARAGVTAVLFLIALVATSIWRKELEIHYEPWQWAHDLLSIGIAGLSLYHIFNVNYYTAVPAQRILWIVLAGIWGAGLLYTRVIRPWNMLRHPYEVTEVKEELGDSWTLTVTPKGHEGMSFRPGQFAWLVIWKSPFSISSHPFSFASSAEQSQHIQFTIKELGDWTKRIKDVPIGKEMYLDGPYGTFGIDDYDAPGYIFIAGGSGSVPFLSMLRTMADRDDQRPVYFFYGNWNMDTCICRDDLDALEEQLNLEVIHVLESPPEDWTGETGFVTKDVLDRHLPPERTEYQCFICGPLPMIENVELALEALEIPEYQSETEKYEMA